MTGIPLYQLDSILYEKNGEQVDLKTEPAGSGSLKSLEPANYRNYRGQNKVKSIVSYN